VTDLTAILDRARQGDAAAHEQVFVALYDELRVIARQHFARESAGHTLQSTALVHEAWLRLVGQTRVEWQNRAHFLAVASTAMRRVLVDHARRVGSDKRGGKAPHFSLTVAQEIADGGSPDAGVDILALEEALERLAIEYPEHARIVELRFYGGLTAKEAAEVLGVTERTAERHWRFARAWLYKELEGE
jgi:RNA polymerase sigma factor (TIGR02999 family)